MSFYPNIDFDPQTGVCKGIYYGQNERVDELNQRMESRYFPDIPLPANYDPRASSTRFCKFPAVNIRGQNANAKTEIKMDQTQGQFIYSPATQRGPPNTVINNVDIETLLRNEKDYIPSSKSDLYRTVLTPPTVLCSANTGENIHAGLFTKYSYNKNIPDSLANGEIGGGRFHNHTKTQLRGSNKSH